MLTEGKGKIKLPLSLKTERGSRNIDPLILNLDCRLTCFLAPSQCAPVERNPVLSEWEDGVSYSRSGRLRKIKYLFIVGNGTMDCPAHISELGMITITLLRVMDGYTDRQSARQIYGQMNRQTQHMSMFIL
jgi:hypothetical protein